MATVWCSASPGTRRNPNRPSLKAARGRRGPLLTLSRHAHRPARQAPRLPEESTAECVSSASPETQKGLWVISAHVRRSRRTGEKRFCLPGVNHAINSGKRALSPGPTRRPRRGGTPARFGIPAPVICRIKPHATCAPGARTPGIDPSRSGCRAARRSRAGIRFPTFNARTGPGGQGRGRTRSGSSSPWNPAPVRSPSRERCPA